MHAFERINLQSALIIISGKRSPDLFQNVSKFQNESGFGNRENRYFESQVITAPWSEDRAEIDP